MRLAILTAGAVLLFAGCGANRPSEEKKPASGLGSITRLDPVMDTIAPIGAQIEKVAGGFQFTEGPVWLTGGRLWFSDVQGNVVRQWTLDTKVKEILRPGGFDGSGAPAGAFIGPNGMVAGQDGSVLICQHGNRRIVRLSADGKVTTLVDRFEGKRFNSPNDLTYRSDESLYFTDPPYGLTGGDQDPKKELPFNGVFRLSEKGKLTVVIKDLSRPNGIAISPDQKVLYVANSDPAKKIWMQYDLQPDGSVGDSRVFFDVTSQTEDGLPDGMKVDVKGNLYCTGPGGVWVFSSAGKHLGTIKPPETPANCNWGEDGRTLYITARTSVYRIQLGVAGKSSRY